MSPLLLAAYCFCAIVASGAGLYLCYLLYLHGTILRFARDAYLASPDRSEHD